MSNPTELPDLDKLEADALECLRTYQYVLAEPDKQLALIRLARRAQPEGEAHVAVAQVRLDADSWMDVPAALLPSWKARKFETRTLYAAATLSPLCGAQHAESGKEEMADRIRKLEAIVLGSCEDLGALHNAFGFDPADPIDTDRMICWVLDWRAQQAAAPGAVSLLNADELAALHRFQETCQDFDSGGYDVDKDMMKRLAAIGVIESKGFNRYQFTEFGDHVVEHHDPSAPGTPEAPPSAAARDVLAERQRQVEVEGWTPARDDEYVDGQLASAAVAYAQAYTPYLVPSSWPWAVEWFKPADDRRNLVKAGALIVAEIERLDRAAQLDGGQEGSDHA